MSSFEVTEAGIADLRGALKTLATLVDGGFAMGQNLPMFDQGVLVGDEGDPGGTVTTTSDGERKIIPGKADFGTVSSGGLY